MVTPGTLSGPRAVRRRPPAHTPAPARPAFRRRALVAATVPAAVLLAPACGDGPAVTPPTARPAATAPSIAAVTPALGSTGGATPVRVTGVGFQSGRVVTIGGNAVPVSADLLTPGVLYLDTPAHAAGPVDVVVANPDGQAVTAAGAYTYAAPESFDFDGTWFGFGNAGQDIPIAFVIRDNVLERVWCDNPEGPPATLSPAPSAANGAVSGGAFSYARDDGVVVMSGRIVSGSDAVGTMDIAPCSATTWGATRAEPPR
jgi:hypothetical protein